MKKSYLQKVIVLWLKEPRQLNLGIL